jgi:hypothetical protein
MAKSVAHEDMGAIVQHLRQFVTCGPWDLDIAWAMSAHGYNAAKWAEGEGLLAELVSCDLPMEESLATAARWYREAAATARCALTTQPQLLAKLGVAEASPE